MTPALKLFLALYVAAGLALIGAYALAETFGWEPFESGVQTVVPSVRTPPGDSGGSGSFWHSGSRGGK
ncbi:MAG: hypothetical protein IPJ77_13345 [Planctomycetes bacterium]|nr:hypothetical protein [Planctomycetota bacterium]